MLTSLSAYVQQEDLFIPTLTVREHLIFQALVRMHRYLNYHQRMVRVEEVIQEVCAYFIIICEKCGYKLTTPELPFTLFSKW